jgi:hypothetical protein
MGAHGTIGTVRNAGGNKPIVPVLRSLSGLDWLVVIGGRAQIVAGFVLGYLAGKTKSIWGGVWVHCAAVVTRDLLALARKNQWPWLHG